MANNEDYDVADIDIDYVDEVNRDECDNRDEIWEIDPDDDYVQKERDSSTVN